MAIFRVMAPSNQTRELPRKMLDYILNPQKTNEMLVSGIGCRPNTEDALRTMWNTKDSYRKTAKRQVVHSVLSFDSREPVTNQEVLNISRKIAEEIYCGHQCVIAVHTNTAHLHSHIVVNSVNVATGLKFNTHKKDFLKQRDLISQILMKYGKKPLVGFVDADFSTPYYSDEDMEDKDWLEIFPESEQIVVMSGNTLPDIIREVDADLFDDCDDEPSLSECYFLTVAKKYGYPAARAICDIDEPSCNEYDSEEDNNMKSTPTLRLGGGIIVTTDKYAYNKIPDLYGEIIKRIPDDVLYAFDVEICVPNLICGASQDVIDEVVKAVNKQSLEGTALYNQLPDKSKE